MRASRIVILPDFQGMGLGSYLSNYIAGSYVQGGYRYFSKTVNPALGEYRESHSDLWKPTSKNGKLQGDHRGTITKHNDWKILRRRSYCHEFINEQWGDPRILLHKRKDQQK